MPNLIDVEYHQTGKSIITIEADGKKEEITFSISEFDKDLVKAGGWLNFADSNY